MRKVFHFINHNFLLCFGMLMLVLLLSFTFLGQYAPFINQGVEEIPFKMTDGKISVPPYEPSSEHLLGTDREGRDLLSLLAMGAKETLLIIVTITILRYLLAIPLAYLAHKNVFGANPLLKVLNGFFSYVPTIVMVILLAMLPPLLLTESRPYYLIVIIAAMEVGRAAETIKQELDECTRKEYILSGIAVGAGPVRLLKSYYLPFLYGKLLVSIISDLGKVMFLLGQLGFIGIFISQDIIQVEIGMFEIRNESISWPMLLMEATSDIRGPIWIPFWSAFAMTFTIFTFNILAQGIQNLEKKKASYLV